MTVIDTRQQEIDETGVGQQPKTDSSKNIEETDRICNIGENIIQFHSSHWVYKDAFFHKSLSSLIFIGGRRTAEEKRFVHKSYKETARLIHITITIAIQLITES